MLEQEWFDARLSVSVILSYNHPFVNNREGPEKSEPQCASQCDALIRMRVLRLCRAAASSHYCRIGLIIVHGPCKRSQVTNVLLAGIPT